jgi:deoxyribonuclease-4
LKLSALTSSLPVAFSDAIEPLAMLGFSWIDVPPAAATGRARRLIGSHALRVACVALEREMPAGLDLTSTNPDVRGSTMNYLCGAIEQTHALGATVAYVTPPKATDAATRNRWTDSLVRLADHAAATGVRVCIEHFPGRLLPTVRDTLEFLRSIGHGSLAIVIDVGHCLLSGEDPARAVADSGRWLGYIHFDDNDGRDDLHWPLLTGRLTEQQIRSTVAALAVAGYDGGLCLELNAKLPDPVENLRRGKALLERFLSP